MKYACTSYRPPKRGSKKEKVLEDTNKINSLHGNIKAWSLYIDLLENLSTFENTKAAYDRMMEMKIATP